MDETLAEAERVVLLDRTLVLEAADAIEVRRRGAPRGRWMRRGVREARVVARAEAVEHTLRRLARGRLREAQFGDEPILEGAEESLDPALIWYEIVRCSLPSARMAFRRGGMVRPSGEGAPGARRTGRPSFKRWVAHPSL